MKKFKGYKEIIILFIIIILGFVWFQYLGLKNNGDFAFDVVKSINEIYQSRGTEKKEDNSFVSAYLMKQHIDNAEKIMEKWKDNKDGNKKEIISNIISGIDDLKNVSDLYISILNDPSEQDLALFKVKLGSGREKIISAVGVVLVDGKGMKISKKQKNIIVNYINNVFQKELKNYDENSKNEGFTQPEEIWAVMMIRNGLQK